MRPMRTVRFPAAAPLALTVVCCASGCRVGTRSGPTGARLRRPRRVRVAPQAVRAGAALPDRALLLGTGAGDMGTWLPLAGTARTVALDARWAQTGAGEGVRLTLTAAPVRAPEAARLEAPSRPLGAAAWTAALAATSAVDKDVTDYQLSARGTQAIDRSASALLAVGYLAAFTGARVDPRATVIGDVLIDGTIGPVPGLAGRVRAAAAAGAVRIGVPRAEKLAGVAAARTVAVGDLGDAYALLTPGRIPATTPVRTSAMALGPALAAAVRAAYRRRRRALSADWVGVAQLASAGPLPPPVRALIARAQTRALRAERAFRRGAVAVAWARLGSAAVAARAAVAVRKVVAAVRAGDAGGAAQPFSAIGPLRAQLYDEFLAIAKRAPQQAALAGQLSTLFGFQWAIRAEAMLPSAQASRSARTRSRAAAALPEDRRRLRATVLAVADAALPPLLAAERARACLALAREQLAIAPPRPGAGGAGAAALRRLGDSYAAAARARLARADAGAGDTAGSAPEPRLAPYRVASTVLGRSGLAAGIPSALRARWGADATVWRLATLAGKAAAYYATARLVDVRGVGVAADPVTGFATRVENPAAIAQLLASGERKAREHAHAAQVATGRIPAESRLAYQVARGLAGGDTDDRVTALELYWASSLSSELAVELARNAAPPPAAAAASR